jgi:hypothetical protein
MWKFCSRSGQPTEDAREIAVRFTLNKLPELNEINDITGFINSLIN